MVSSPTGAKAHAADETPASRGREHSIYNNRRRHGDEAELLPPSRSAVRPVRKHTRPTKHPRPEDGCIRFIIIDDAITGDEADSLLPPSRPADRPVRRRTRPTKHTRHGDGSIRFIIFDDAMETKPSCCRPHGQQSGRCESTHGRRSTRVARAGAFDL